MFLFLQGNQRSFKVKSLIELLCSSCQEKCGVMFGVSYVLTRCIRNVLVSPKKKVIKMTNIYSCIILGHIQPNVRNLGTPVFHGIFNGRSVRKQRNHIGQDKPTRYNRYRTKIWHVHARIRFSRIRTGKSRGM